MSEQQYVDKPRGSRILRAREHRRFGFCLLNNYVVQSTIASSPRLRTQLAMALSRSLRMNIATRALRAPRTNPAARSFSMPAPASKEVRLHSCKPSLTLRQRPGGLRFWIHGLLWSGIAASPSQRIHSGHRGSLPWESQ